MTKRMPTRIAVKKRSAGSVLLRCSRFHCTRTAMMPMYDKALRPNTSHGPMAATSTPAMAGPIARDTLTATLFERDGRTQLVGRDELRDDGRTMPASSSPTRRPARR